MGPLARQIATASAGSSAVLLLLALGAGAVRVLPWALAPDVPYPVLVPFVEALLVVAVETAFLVGVPVGCALGAAVLVERGEIRALLALGARPSRLVLGAAPVVLGFALLQAGIGLAWDAEVDRPGEFAGELIQKGKASCAGAHEVRSMLVPMLGMHWLCFPGHEPLITGALPHSNGRAWFTASDVVPSATLQAFEARDLELATRPTNSGFRLKLAVGTASIRGLSSWGRQPGLSAEVRAVTVSVCLTTLALLATWLVIVAASGGRIVALLAGLVPAVAALRALHSTWLGQAGMLVFVLGIVGVALLAFSVVAGASLRFSRQSAAIYRYLRVRGPIWSTLRRRSLPGSNGGDN